MTRPDELSELRVSDVDRNGTLRRLHNAVALGLIDITEFEERSSNVSYARTRNELDNLVVDLPGPGAIVTSAAASSCAGGPGRSSGTASGRSRAGSLWFTAWVRSSWIWSRPDSRGRWS